MRSRVLAIAGSVLLWCSLAAGARQETPKPQLPSNPGDLVRAAIDNELKPGNGVHKAFKLTSRKGNETTVKQVVETKEGAIARIILVNGKPLEGEAKAKEDARLQRLIDDPSALVAKQKSQKEDDRRTRAMLNALPDAFIYQYAGTAETPEGTAVNLTFKPNPDWDPPSRETMVYRGMQGTMQINLPGKRLIRIQAKLFKDVTFGWGILGHLDQGGQFIVEQAPVLDHDWEINHMVLNFTGKALLFKTIRIQQDESSSDFHLVPEMTARQAIEELNKGEIEQASGQQK